MLLVILRAWEDSDSVQPTGEPRVNFTLICLEGGFPNILESAKFPSFTVKVSLFFPVLSKFYVFVQFFTEFSKVSAKTFQIVE